MLFDTGFFELGDCASDQRINDRFVPSRVYNGNSEGRAVMFLCELREVLDRIAHRRLDD